MFAIFMNKKMLPVIPVEKILSLIVNTVKKMLGYLNDYYESCNQR